MLLAFADNVDDSQPEPEDRSALRFSFADDINSSSGGDGGGNRKKGPIRNTRTVYTIRHECTSINEHNAITARRAGLQL